MAGRWLWAGFLAGAVSLLVAAGASAGTTVFAAASLSDALTDVGKAYRAKTGAMPTFSFAASSVLAKQIETSAGADIFISADTDWMDYLDSRGFIARGTRKNLLGNHLVLIAPASSSATLTIAPHFNLLGALQGGRLSIADPDTVPAGKYARTALMTLGVWDSVVNRTVNAENVRVALAYVSRGEAPLGIVYTTDALSDRSVRVVATFPDNTHAAIVYPAALTRDAKPETKTFFDFLSGPEAQAIFQKDGFVLLGAKP